MRHELGGAGDRRSALCAADYDRGLLPGSAWLKSLLTRESGPFEVVRAVEIRPVSPYGSDSGGAQGVWSRTAWLDTASSIATGPGTRVASASTRGCVRRLKLADRTVGEKRRERLAGGSGAVADTANDASGSR